MADNQRKLEFILAAQNEKFIKVIDQSTKQIQRLEKASGQSIASLTKQFSSLSNRPVASVNRFGRAANDNFNSVRRGMGQLGFQVQDIAVQLQGGQNPLLILSQQGSQVASIFGPSGAVIGALLSVGTILATVFIPGISDSAKALFDLRTNSQKLEDALEELNKRVSINEKGIITYTDRIKELAKVSKAAAEVELGIAIINAEIAVKSATQGIVESVGKIESQFKRIEGSRSIVGRNQGLKKLREDLGLTVAQAKEFRVASQEFLQAPTVENAAKFNELASSLDLNNEKLRNFIADLNTNLVTLNENKGAIEKLKDALSGLAGAYDATKFVEDEDDQTKRIQKQIRAKLDAAKAEEDLQKSRNMELISFTEERLSILEQGFGKESALGKAAFAAQKAIEISKMIVATESAAAQALTLGPIAGPPLSAIIKGLGYASIGVVAGQTIASFEGGGYTGAGMRAGGMDGHGGKMAMLHPNEVVTDLTKSANDSGWKVEVNNYSNNNVRTDIDDKNKIINIMVEQMGNQNSRPSQAFFGISTARPKGNR